MSRPSRARGLKSTTTSQLTEIAESRPSRARGLKSESKFESFSCPLPFGKRSPLAILRLQTLSVRLSLMTCVCLLVARSARLLLALACLANRFPVITLRYGVLMLAILSLYTYKTHGKVRRTIRQPPTVPHLSPCPDRAPCLASCPCFA